MSNTFIAAYDGSAASRAAVRFAVELAAAQDAQVIAVHAYPRVHEAGLRGGVFDADLQIKLRESGRRVIESLDIEGVGRRALVAGSPAHAVHEVAEEQGASLIVVGATHHGPIGRVAPGSVASKLLHGAPCPVLVVPAERKPGPIRTVVAAYDESAQSRAALCEAQRLARAFGARLSIIAAHEPQVFAAPAMVATTELDDLLRGELAQRVQKQADAIADIKVDTNVAIGPARELIIDAAQGADLLVAGSRGYGPLHSVLVGSVSRHLVDHATCPVLVLPRVAEEAEDRLPEANVSAQPA